MMFELNSHMIQKMGWFCYHPSVGLGVDFPGLFSNDKLVRFFFIDRTKNIIFLIKEMTSDEKQKTKKEYKFIDFVIPVNSDTKMNVVEFTSNGELWKIIIENEACSEDYQRQFRLNKILK